MLLGQVNLPKNVLRKAGECAFDEMQRICTEFCVLLC